MKEIKHQISDESYVYIGDQVDRPVYHQVGHQVYDKVHDQVYRVSDHVWRQIVNDAYQKNFDLLPERTFVPQALNYVWGYGEYENAVAYAKKTSTPSGNFLIPYISKLFQKMRGLLG